MKYKLYHSSSQYLSLKAAHRYLEDIRKNNSNIQVLIIDGDNVKPQQIVDIISSPSLFSSERLLFIKRIYRNKEKSLLTDTLMEFLSKAENNDIYIFWEDQKIKANTKYYKFFKKNNALEEIAELNKRTFYTWLKKELEEEDLKIDSAVIKELAERTNYDPERCSNELKKFKLNNEKRVIQKEDIDTFTADTLEKDIWNLTDAINAGDKESSAEILEKLSSQFADPNYIIAMLARNIRLIYLAKTLTQKKLGYREISSILKVPPFTTPNLIKTSSNYSVEKIKLIYSKLSNLDYQIKKGLIDGQLGITLLLKLCF